MGEECAGTRLGARPGADTDAVGRFSQCRVFANRTMVAKKIIGTAEADVIATKVHAAGNAADYAAIIRADATKNWNGSVPHVQLESEGGGQPILVLPQQIEK